MSFQSLENLVKPRIGQTMSLGRGHIDPATLVLTFHYQEKQESGGVWSTMGLDQPLAEGVHYSLNARDGTITLLPHAFWQSESTWRAGDRVESLLYKGAVKHPQRVSGSFDYYAPESIEVVAQLDGLGASGKPVIAKINNAAITVDLEEVDAEAQARLGYDVPKYTEAIDG